MRCSVLGDSISTFAGVTLPPEAVFYDRYLQRISGVTAVDDTWWMQVIKALGGRLGAVSAVSGSTVSGTGLWVGTADRRIADLGRGGAPDRILVWMGANDWGFGLPIGAADTPRTFACDYRRMLRKLRAAYPGAEILCGTLLRGADPPDDEEAFFNAEAAGPLVPYNDAIRQAAADCGCRPADLGDALYETVDGAHPNRAGMAQIAAAWRRAIGAP